MRAIWAIFRQMLRGQRVALARGAGLGVTVLLAGFALLGVSGWFITAAAAAGLAGTGAVFDVFRPSAAVRFLALGRTAARYGERLLTHDATLRALSTLRVGLLDGLTRAPFARLGRLRGAQMLNRLMADVDALDGIPLRLILPVATGAGALAVAALVLWGLTGPVLALWICGGYVALALVLALWGLQPVTGPARRAERARQAFRARLIDLLRARDDLAVYGLLDRQRVATLDADDRRRAERRILNRKERGIGALVAVGGVVILAGAVWFGDRMVGAEPGAAPFAALALFAAMALAETIAPLRRFMADFGRMADAAGRVRRMMSGSEPDAAGDLSAEPPQAAVAIEFERVVYRRGQSAQPVLDTLSLAIAPGECVALTGPSGRGKSTVLLLAAGLIQPDAGRIRIAGQSPGSWSQGEFWQRLSLLPQRSALMSGTVRQAMALARPGMSDAEAQAVLTAVDLERVLAPRGGLDLELGESGSGLSGGEQRRLALARVLLRRPEILLLDEPTEGLDDATAARVLAGLRDSLPDATILLASHRALEQSWADRVVRLK